MRILLESRPLLGKLVTVGRWQRQCAVLPVHTIHYLRTTSRVLKPVDHIQISSPPMALNIPEEIFHRIMWDHQFSRLERLELLSHEYHLQLPDRQCRFYTFSDFQNARLVCRMWNKWLSNDFAFWKHFCIQGEKSLEIAKNVTARFPAHPFHISVRVDHVSSDDFYQYCDSEEEEDETDEVELGDAHVAGGGDEAVGFVLDLTIVGSITNCEESEDSESEDLEHNHDGTVVKPAMAKKLPGPWVQDAIELVLSILPQLEAISLRLPTQTIHKALTRWANIGAPGLRRCSLEATDYDGRTYRDCERYVLSTNPREHKPLPPPLAPFLHRSPILESVTIRNYYVPIWADQDIAYDPMCVEKFSLTYDGLDAPIVGPLNSDVKASLMAHSALRKCKDLTFDLDIGSFDLSFRDLQHLFTLRKLTLGHGKLDISSASLTDPLPAAEICHIKHLTLSNMLLRTGPVTRGVSSYLHIIQFLLNDMPNLESLCLIDVRFAVRSEVNVTLQSLSSPSILPNFKRLLIEDGTYHIGQSASLDLLPLMKRTPSLTRLSFTWIKEHVDDMEKLMEGLGAVGADGQVLLVFESRVTRPLKNRNLTGT